MSLRIFAVFIALSIMALACRQQDGESNIDAIFDSNVEFYVVDKSDALYRSIGQVSSDVGSGTAFFVGSQMLATNAHVTDGCDYDSCSLVYNGRYRLKLVARRLYPDVAVLAIVNPDEALKANPLSLEAVADTDKTVSVAQVYGIDDGDVLLSHDRGEVLSRTEKSYWAEIEYRINTKPGSSGSPVLNERLDVVAIHKGSSETAGRNVATTSESLQLLLDRDRVGEVNVLMSILESSHDQFIKYDLAQIFLEEKVAGGLFLGEIKARICGSNMASSIAFYFRKIRKIDIAC